jgi:hypothetical protein
LKVAFGYLGCDEGAHLYVDGPVLGGLAGGDVVVQVRVDVQPRLVAAPTR